MRILFSHLARLLRLAMFVLALACAVPGPSFADSDTDLEEQIGQMLLIGFRGLAADASSPIVQDIRSGRIGGVILFDYDVALKSPVRNVASPEQVQKLVADLQAEVSGLPLFVAIEQEGGRVSRLKEKYGFPPTVSQGWLGEQNNLALTARHARQTAKTLAGLGINVNLAPVVDVNVNPDNPVIGKLERSFSADPMIVAEHALEVIITHQVEGVIPALKHFPGHGSSAADSHLGFTDVTHSWSDLELLPYREILRSAGADMIMTAHVFNAALDPDWPATLSQATIQGLLRDQMGYQGVVISDDMQMQAITDHYSLETALERTIQAGADVIIFGNNLEYDERIAKKAVQAVTKLVREGRVSPERIKESYSRIMFVKNRLIDRGDQDCRLCDAY